MNDIGYISVHRKIIKWEWYQDPTTMRLFVHCLLLANWEPKRWQGKAIERGQFITSIAHLARDLKVSVKSIRTALEHLKSTNEVAIETTSQYSLITVINYNTYQDKGQAEGTPKGTQKGNQGANEGQTKGKRGATTNNYNNYNNYNKGNKNTDLEGVTESHMTPHMDPHMETVPPRDTPPTPAVKPNLAPTGEKWIAVPNCPSLRLTRLQIEDLKTRYAAHGLDKQALLAACEALEHFAQNVNPEKFRAYKNHALVLIDWPLRKAMEIKMACEKGTPKTFEQLEEERAERIWQETKRKFLAKD